MRWLREILLGPEKPPALEEERYPRDAQGRPDLARFTKPLEHYTAYVDAYLTSLGPGGPRESAWQVHAYRKGVLGQWGLIAKGPGQALPYVLQLLRNPLPEARSAAAGVLDAWDHDDLVRHMLEAAERETDPEALGVLLGALGRRRVSSALPLLARVLRSPASRTGDVDWSAMEALGRIAGKRFERAPDPRAAADAWLKQQGL